MLLLGLTLLLLAAYLLGSIPTGFLVAKARGVDIRKVGSGNIGATNVFRAVGKTLGVLVLLGDGLKGYLACTWGCDLVLAALRALGLPTPAAEPARIVSGIGAVLGHNFTCWLRFRGGKGVATSAGVFAALAPGPLLLAVGVWVVLFLITRYVSVASIGAAVALPTATWLMQTNLLLSGITTALGVLAIARHHANIRRLLQGTENRITFKRKSTTA